MMFIESHNCCHVAFSSRLNYELYMGLRIACPSGSGFIEAVIARPKDAGGVRNLDTKLALDLVAGQGTTGD
jgi:hypothetical protein